VDTAHNIGFQSAQKRQKEQHALNKSPKHKVCYSNCINQWHLLLKSELIGGNLTDIIGVTQLHLTQMAY